MSRKPRLEQFEMDTKTSQNKRSSWYNNEPVAIIGLTPERIGKRFIFYVAFYSVLGAIFAICMATFLQHFINPRVPRLQQEYSVIGTSPGLGFRPLPPDVRSTLIWYKGTGPESYKYWEEQLRDFLSVYKKKGQTAGAGQNIFNCNFKEPPPPGKVCDVDIRGMEPCTEENHFSFHKSSPCIFLKLNRMLEPSSGTYISRDYDEDSYSKRSGKSPRIWENFHQSLDITVGHLPMRTPLRMVLYHLHPELNKAYIIYGWRPEFYNNVNELPQDMPDSLQARIKNITAYNSNYANMVWVSCNGETPADKENIGPINYLPFPGFPGYFYPYENAEGYLSPLVAIHLQKPQTGIIINVECRAWAKNIIYDRRERLGVVHFEIMIE